ncbi:receptor-type tyrosine-protein phosphatase-like N isoform X3 [Nerophis lumbriciformis]|uniref:receptor-type tyrosine-protein phosphatase-like N isoform X3 n=1 Tax=Nerophis lumbriciformis TaxID=546530 RepID=UPI002ADF46B4|nr:receptor-type tyrosine-protein phosphatase-like N isoform X3 [Nerophis lumbriciformis]
MFPFPPIREQHHHHHHHHHHHQDEQLLLRHVDLTDGSLPLLAPDPLRCTMTSRRLWAAVCLLLLLASSCRLTEAAGHGCLFEKNLCPRDHLCNDDGLFGQCRAPHQDPVQYLVSVPTLHKLQEVLKDLMVQGMTWKDDVTQATIGRELSYIPTVGSWQLHERKQSLSQRRRRRAEESGDPEMVQQFLQYLTFDPSQSSMHVQTPLLEPYTYHQQKFGDEDETERSLNSLEENPISPFHRVLPRQRSQGKALDRDRQLLQHLVSYYLTSPSSSSTHVRAVSRHKGAPGTSSALASSLPELDLPLDYDQDYLSQVKHLSKEQQQQRSKLMLKYDARAGLDARSLQRLALLLDHYGLDVKDLSPEQMGKLPDVLKQLQLESSFSHKSIKDNYGNNAATGKKFTEGSMEHKMATPNGVPNIRSSKPVQVQKETNSTTMNKAENNMIDVLGPATAYGTHSNSRNLPAVYVAEKQNADKNFLEPEAGLKVVQSSDRQPLRSEGQASLLATPVQPGSRWLFATLVASACIGGVLLAALSITCLRNHAHRLATRKLGLGTEAGSFNHQEYQDLCRQHMASKGAFGRLEAAALGAVGGASGGGASGAGRGAGAVGGIDSRVSSVSSQFSDGAQPSPSSHSSTPSWCEEPAQANMDISTGHMILAYMEDHLRNKDRLFKEWEALCSYQAEPSSVTVAQTDPNVKKNRFHDSLPYDHARVKLKAEINPSRSDYINASTIIEHDPRMPAYIATQGPLSHTISDFWQMVWESGCTVIVMMTALVEEGEKQCDRYWPDEGSSLYHIYEVNLVSEHIWCKDFLVRSFYLKNVQTQETRTLTQFHFLSWPAHGIPTSTRPLLDFRRKVNKCYRGRSCPIIVHCSNGTGRTGTYILIDMVLNRMAKGVKEIDIAATLEHVRDQRPGMVRTKDQFEFALTAVAEEVNAIIKALPQ